MESETQHWDNAGFIKRHRINLSRDGRNLRYLLAIRCYILKLTLVMSPPLHGTLWQVGENSSLSPASFNHITLNSFYTTGFDCFCNIASLTIQGLFVFEYHSTNQFHTCLSVCLCLWCISHAPLTLGRCIPGGHEKGSDGFAMIWTCNMLNIKTFE